MASMLYGMEKPCQELAVLTVTKVLEIDENHAGALMLLAIIQKDRGYIEEATRLFIQLLVQDQDNSQLK